jgi:hypothetical protein
MTLILSTTLAGPPPKLGYFDQNGSLETFTERMTESLSVTRCTTQQDKEKQHD